MRLTSVSCSAISTFISWLRNELSDARPTARIAARNSTDVAIAVLLARLGRVTWRYSLKSFCVAYNLRRFDSFRSHFEDSCSQQDVCPICGQRTASRRTASPSLIDRCSAASVVGPRPDNLDGGVLLIGNGGVFHRSAHRRRDDAPGQLLRGRCRLARGERTSVRSHVAVAR